MVVIEFPELICKKISLFCQVAKSGQKFKGWQFPGTRMYRSRDLDPKGKANVFFDFVWRFIKECACVYGNIQEVIHVLLCGYFHHEWDVLLSDYFQSLMPGLFCGCEAKLRKHHHCTVCVLHRVGLRFGCWGKFSSRSPMYTCMDALIIPRILPLFLWEFPQSPADFSSKLSLLFLKIISHFWQKNTFAGQ